MFWYRQSPGESPEFVSRINYDGSGQRYADWVRGRFTISRDNARSQLHLGMSRLGLEDTARYPCAARDTVRGSRCELRQKPPVLGLNSASLRAEGRNPARSVPEERGNCVTAGSSREE
ncbi:unnamed protein product [Lepidochelys olivacea]